MPVRSFGTRFSPLALLVLRFGAQTVADIQRALEAAGVEFIDENGGGPGMRLSKRKGRKR